MTRTGPPQRTDRGVVLALAAMALGVFVIANDFTSLSVALPQIEHDFDVDVDTVQWVINAYALVFGVLIVTGGRLADLFGRRRIFFTGSAIFAAFSLLGGLATSEGWLITARGLMGIGGAMIWPAVLGMTYALLPQEKAGLAGGLIIGTAGLGNAMGPLIGGTLTELLSWRWILFLNLPIAAFAALVTWREVRVAPVSAAGRAIDYEGTLTLSIGVVALLLALDEVTDSSWTDPRIAALLAIAAVLITAFVFVEGRAGERALVPREVMSERAFTSACLAVLLMSAAFFVAVVYLPELMQKVLGYSALESGLGLLPMMGVFAATSFVAGPLYGRVGAKAVVSAGAACIAAGMLTLSFVPVDPSYTSLLPGMAVLGVGIGLFYSSVTTAAVTALDPSRASLAGGIVYMFQVAGGAVGLGLTTTVFSTSSESRLAELAASAGIKVTEGRLEAMDGLLAGRRSAQHAIDAFGPDVADRLTALVRDAFMAGFQTGFRLDAALAVVAFFVALLFVGGPAHTPGRADEPEA